MTDKSPPDQISLIKVHGLMIAASFLVSTSFTVGKAITHALDPAVLTLIRFILASAFFAPYIIRRHGLHIPSGQDFCRYSLISATIVAFFWFMFESLKYTTALNTSAIYTLVPGISGIYGIFLVKEHLDWQRSIALVLGIIGALWIIFEGDPARLIALDLNRGDLLFFIGCLAMAFYTPLVKRLHHGEPMTLMTFWVLVTGSGWLLLLAVPELSSTPWLTTDISIWAGIIYLATFSTIITFFLTQFAILYLGSTRVMSYSYLYPAMVLIIDWLAGTALPPAIVIPGVIVVVAATLIIQNRRTGDKTNPSALQN